MKSNINILHNIPLAPLTTFGIGGKARFFVKVSNVGELAEAVEFSKDNSLPIFVLGGGSNVLISDDGFDGLVIKMNICGIRHDVSDGHVVSIIAGAGEMWDNVVAKSVELKAGGIENLSLIPGTVGGAVYQNIGAYGVELRDVLTSVQVFDTSSGNIMRLPNKECGFGYRSSVFKKNKNIIILEAELKLTKNFVPNLSYPELQKRFEGQSPSIAEIRNSVIEIRKNKLPYPDEIGNAGSFFKNPVVPVPSYQLLLSNYPDLKGRDVGDGLVKLSAAQLIEKAGLKGKRIRDVGISEKHALVLVNYGNGTSKELADIEAMIKGVIEAKFDVRLELEVERI